MIRLVCSRCGKVWYTANTLPGQKCGDCSGELKEEKMPQNKQKDDTK